MRILFVTGEYPAMQGGVGDYTRQLSQALCVSGSDVHVLTHVDAGGDHLRTPAAAREPTVYPVMRQTGWQLWRDVSRAVRELLPDAIHIQYQSAAYGLHPAVNFLPWRLRAELSRAGLKQRRSGILTTFHDLRVPYLFPKAGPLRHQAVVTLARGSDASVVTNPLDWASLARVGLACRLWPIAIGSNIEPQPPKDYSRPKQRTAVGAGADDWLLGYFGFLNANKGGETLIRALAELTREGYPVRLLMVGGQIGSSDPTNVSYLERIEALIAELGLSGRVKWTGFTSSEEVSANLLATDCMVLPYREGASLRHGSLMAALAHGLPIVSTQAPTVGRQAEELFPMVRDGVSALLTPPDDPGQTAAAVMQIMTNPALRTRLAQGASEISRQFRWDAIAARHLEMYRGLGLA